MQIAVVPFTGAFVEQEKTWIGGGAIELFLRDPAQQLDGVMVDLLPKQRVEPPEQGAEVMVPTPHQVVGDLEQTSEMGRQSRANQELFQRLYLIRHGTELQ